MPEIPMGDVPDAPTSSVPEGEYRARIVSVEMKYSKAGNETWNITFRIIGGPYDDSPIYDNLVDTKPSWWKWKRMYEAAGYKVDETIDCDPVRDLMNKSMILKVVTEKPPPDAPSNWTDKSKPTIYRRDTGEAVAPAATEGSYPQMEQAAAQAQAAAPVDDDEPGPVTTELPETLDLEEDVDFF